MVVKRRLLLAVASALTLMLIAAAPMVGATKEAKPSPLRSSSLLRVKDVATDKLGSEKVVAVGWHEGTKPGQLWLTFSRDGGATYSKNSGKMRRFPVVGVPSLGMSLDICAGRVWVGSAYRSSSDRRGDSDVFLTSRRLGGEAAQALMTSTSKDRQVRDVSVACAGNDLLAIAWLEKKGSKERARLMLRSLEKLGTAPKFKRTFNLGPAELGSGLAVAGTSDSVAVAYVQGGHLRLKRFGIGKGIPPNVTGQATQSIAFSGISDPVMAALGQRLVVAYSDAGKVKVEISDDLGATFSNAKSLINTGNAKHPSRPYSLDVVGKRIVLEAGAWSKDDSRLLPRRVQSTDSGATWGSRAYGHKGTRVGALLRGANKSSQLMEAWHNNAPKGSNDTLRARYEQP